MTVRTTWTQRETLLALSRIEPVSARRLSAHLHPNGTRSSATPPVGSTTAQLDRLIAVGLVAAEQCSPRAFGVPVVYRRTPVGIAATPAPDDPEHRR